MKSMLVLFLTAALVSVVGAQDKVKIARLKLLTPEIVLPDIYLNGDSLGVPIVDLLSAPVEMPKEIDLAFSVGDTAVIREYRNKAESLAALYTAQSNFCLKLIEYYRIPSSAVK